MFLKKKQFWGTLFAIALLVYCIKDVKFDEIELLFHRMDFIYLSLSIISSFLFIILRSLRWRLMISQQKSIKCFRALSLYSAGQIINIVMPVLTGQVGRLFLFSRNASLKKTFIFSTIVLEVLFDSISLIIFLLLTSLAFVFPEEYRSLSYIISGITIFLLIILYLILHYQYSIEDFSRRHFRSRWPGIYIGVKKFIRSFIQGINLLRSSQHFFGSLIYSLLSWLVHTTVIYFLLMSFGFKLPFAAAASIMIINTIALMIPITPGNAGTFEVAVSTSLAAFAVGRSDAVLFALALHFLDFAPISILGYIFLHTEKVSIRKIKSEHEDEIIFKQVSEEGTLIEDKEKV